MLVFWRLLCSSNMYSFDLASVKFALVFHSLSCLSFVLYFSLVSAKCAFVLQMLIHGMCPKKSLLFFLHCRTFLEKRKLNDC